MLFNAINSRNASNTRKPHQRSCWQRQCHLVLCRHCLELKWPQRPCCMRAEQLDNVSSSCMLARERGGHAGVKLAAMSAALITMNRYATLQDHNNTPDQPDQNQTGAVLNHFQRVHAFFMWLVGVKALMAQKCYLQSVRTANSLRMHYIAVHTDCNVVSRLHTYFAMLSKDLALILIYTTTKNHLLMIKYELSTSCHWCQQTGSATAG